MRLNPEDNTLVTAAVTEAERNCNGEIVTIVADASDSYNDVVLHWSILVMFLALAVIAAFPHFYMTLLDRVAGGWGHEWRPGELLAILLFVLALKFLVARLVFGIPAIRFALTPHGTRTRRVRRRAITLFKAAAERRTTGRTGILLYLSLAERRAELVADEAIHSKVAPETWGAAMAALIAEVRAGRPGAGMAAAVAQIGTILAEHFPKTAGDIDELPDRLIEL